MAHYALTAIGDDRPGIVAAVTGALADAGCNLEDSSMTILRGHFAIVLVLDAPDGTDAQTLEAALAPVAGDLGLTVTVRQVDDASRAPASGSARRTVAVHGADRPGIVHAVTAALARSGANIVDLTTHVTGSPDAPFYVLMIDVDVPGGVDATTLERDLDETAAGLGVECHVHDSEPDVL